MESTRSPLPQHVGGAPQTAVMPFATEITFVGPLRSPVQMLDDQSDDGHPSVHDGDTAASLGLAGAPIEGPTHLSQFDPLAVARWGVQWFQHGCISSHFQTMVVEGEQVQTSLTTIGPNSSRIAAQKTDGTSVLVGTAAIGPDHPETELAKRRRRSGEPGELFIIDQLEVGMTFDSGPASISFDEPNGPSYPFSLADKVKRMTEPHPWYTAEGAASSPWGRAIVPFEMLSVLTNKSGRHFPVRGPALGLFLDLEVRMLNGPVFVDEEYNLHHEVVGVGQSRRTESYWIETTVIDLRTSGAVAVVLLHHGVFKESFAEYPRDRLAR
jgi:hypothetical protein